MTLRSAMRAIPGVLVAGLLALAASAPRRAELGPAPPPQLYPPCDAFALSGSGENTYTFVAGGGVTQPLPEGVTVSACSLRVHAVGWSSARFTLQDWDPVALAPDPGTIALRTAFLDPSALQFYTLNRAPRVALVPPVVTRSLYGVADPPRLTTAAEVSGYATTNNFSGYYDPAGSESMPIGRSIPASGPRPALPGPHPVVAHAVCAGDGDLESLRVCQGVARTDSLLAASLGEIVQAFRVSERVELRWVELAAGTRPPSSNFTTALVGITDGAGLPVPTTPMPASLVQAWYPMWYDDVPRWTADAGFDQTLVLEPEHDYWLHVRQAASHRFYARTITGNESPAFNTRIGALYTRATAAAEWSPTPGRALSFKLIGRPAPLLPVPTPINGFRLRVSPNPASDFASISWSGAVGTVRLEVLDARGRRVGVGEGGAAGTWSWSSTGRGGQALPGGVYFVHARDAAGGHANERVVIVR